MAVIMSCFERIKILGEGSYGTIFLAVVKKPEKLKGQLIAIKTSKSNGIRSLQKEGTILDALYGCKEILQSISSKTIRENDRIVHNILMEFAPHGSLDKLIRRKPLLDRDIRVYTYMLLKGLSCIHQRGIVHCDLKPDNILLFPSNEDGVEYQLKIADFGLSKTKDEDFDADFWRIKFRGAPGYMSPESVMGRIETPLDIWSLGCIVIKMITGLTAWEHVPTIRDIMFKLAFLKEAPPIPLWISPHCKDFLNKCFLRDDQRWTANMLLNHPFVSDTESQC